MYALSQKIDKKEISGLNNNTPDAIQLIDLPRLLCSLFELMKKSSLPMIFIRILVLWVHTWGGKK